MTSRFCKSLILAVNDLLLKEPFHGFLRFVLLLVFFNYAGIPELSDHL